MIYIAFYIKMPVYIPKREFANRSQLSRKAKFFQKVSKV